MRYFFENVQSAPANAWLGVTVNRCCDLHRIADLKETDAEVKFVSFEPLYEDLTRFTLDLDGIDWVIIGAQRRPDVQPNLEWLDHLIRRADAVDAPVFLKDNLDLYTPDNPNPTRRQEIPEVEE